MTEAYLAEIAEQPGILERLGTRFGAAWGDQLADLSRKLVDGHFDRVILTGMGGSLHGTYPAQLALSSVLSVPVTSWETGELMQQAPNAVTAKTLLIAVSQSGESGELRRLVDARRPGFAIAVTNAGGNMLARWADLTITTEAGAERTASTKTYTAGLAALALTAAHLTDNGAAASADVIRLAHALGPFLSLMPAQADAWMDHLGATNPYVVVGRGASYASATMGALLIEEAAKLLCEPLTGGQFRHGPLELVREGFRAVVFLGHGGTRGLTRSIITLIANLGGRVITIGTEPGAKSEGVMPVTLPNVAPTLLPIAEIIPIQYLVIPLARARGFAPAAFLNAQKVTTGE